MGSLVAATGGLVFLLLNYLIEERGGWARRLTGKKKKFQDLRLRFFRALAATIMRKQGKGKNLLAVESLRVELEQEARNSTVLTVRSCFLTTSGTVGRGDRGD